MLGFDALGGLALGQISRNPIAVASFTKGDLTLVGREIEIRTTRGSSGSRKKKPTGLEPVKKDWTPPRPEKPKVWTPPRTSAPSIAPSRPAPLVSSGDAPFEIFATMQRMRAAEDASRIRMQSEQDEQDAADIADVLALLD